MVYNTLRVEEHNRVTVISLLGPVENLQEVLQLSAELSECCRRFRENDEQRVLVLTGATRKAFSMAKCLDDFKGESAELPSLATPLAAVERPVIAGISGDAIGFGLEMALACDVLVAADSARFGLPHIKTGTIPWDGGTQRLLRTIGKGKTLEMVLTGDPVDAQEAYRVGLVSSLVPADAVMQTVMNTAREMASKSPVSLEYCKEAVKKGADLTLDQGLRLEADLYFLMHTTKDRSEGIKAFKEKRKPLFKGS
jgi:enoyl-CoA hydratase/carnithine racemase